MITWLLKKMRKKMKTTKKNKIEDSTEKKDEQDETKKDTLNNTLFIKNIPTIWTKYDILDVVLKEKGFEKLVLTEANKYKGFTRIGWLVFKNEECSELALKNLTGKLIREFELSLTFNKKSYIDSAKQDKVTPPVFSEPLRIAIDLERSQKLCLLLDEEKSINNKDNPILSNPDFNKISDTEKLDRILTYLKLVHCFCYYCGEEFDEIDDLYKKCGLKHCRRKRNEGQPIDISNNSFAQSLDERIEKRLSSKFLIENFNGHAHLQKSMEKFYEEHCREEGERDKPIFRCSVCNKCFRESKFVQKHINLKHEEELNRVKKKNLWKSSFL